MTAVTGPGQKERIPSGYKKATLQQFTPEQMQMLSDMMAKLGPDSWLAKLAGGDESEFAAIEAPQKRQFSEAIGQMGSRFSGMGMGAQKSSGFQNTMGSAASNFAQELGAKRFGMKSQALKDLMEMSGMLMGQRPYENALVEKQQKSGLGGWGGVGGAAIGGGAGFFLGGPAGGLAGAKIGHKVGSGFD